MTIGWHFNNTYSKLSDTFREEIKPIPVNDPDLVIFNESLASELNLDFSKIDKNWFVKKGYRLIYVLTFYITNINIVKLCYMVIDVRREF